MLNSNAVHNALNVLLVAIGAIGAVLIYLGCVINDAGAYDCSDASVNPAVLSIAALVIGTLKVMINVVRDGIAGLTKEQPPVQ